MPKKTSPPSLKTSRPRRSGPETAPRSPGGPVPAATTTSENRPAGRQLRDRFSRTFVPPELYDPKRRKEWALGETDSDRGPYVLELNLQHVEGLSGAWFALSEIHKDIVDGAQWPLEKISKTYVRCRMTPDEWRLLLGRDAARATALAGDGDASAAMHYRAIYKLWPDFPVESHIYRSKPTIKADAAFRAYGAAGKGIVWAVIDSGIERTHPHFHFENQALVDAPEVVDLHRAFVSDGGAGAVVVPLADPDEAPDDGTRRTRIAQHREMALADEFGHGTHVAGIIAGGAPVTPDAVCTLERVDRIQADGEVIFKQYDVVQGVDAAQLRGVAPSCRLVSLRVLDANGRGRSSDVIRALDYIRERLNDNPKLLRIHGVNLSVGYEFDAEMFACGQSPLCAEVNRLVQSGVVVVAAAGNTGYGTVGALSRPAKVGLSNTINDPGNAELAITVGATHRDAPHTYGVSYFSSKGPTGDGRQKPDLVAPGERIVSCAAGLLKAEAVASAGPRAATATAHYIEDSGTSMAAPHVSGAIAAFLSIRREFIGKPLDVKRIFCSTSTSLGRERYFQGHGLVDLIRAIQSV